MSLFDDLKNGAATFYDNWKSGVGIMTDSFKRTYDTARDYAQSGIESIKSGIDSITSRFDKSDEIPAFGEDTAKKFSFKDAISSTSEKIKDFFDLDRIMSEAVEHEYDSITGKDSNLADRMYDSSTNSIDWGFLTDTENDCGIDLTP